MASRQCLVEVNRTVRAAGLDEEGVHAAVIGFARNLARRMDKVGAENAPLNLLRLYQGALTNLTRAATPKPVAKPGRVAGEDEVVRAPVSPPALTIVEESPLEKLRREKQERAAG